MALISAIALVGVTPAAAQAQPPANDDFASATAIGSLPFSTTQDTISATSDPSDPRGCHRNGSVWFAFTPTRDMLVRASTLGSDYSTVLSAWTGSQGSLTRKACNSDYFDQDRDEPESRITFAATAGTTYYFMVVPWFDDDEEANLQLSVEETTAPENDNFTDAAVVDELPFSHEQDMSGASLETGEPLASCGRMEKSVWYSFTPTTTQSLTARMNYWGGVVVYTGTSLADLTPIACSNVATFRAEAGTTYLFQVAESRCCSSEMRNGMVGLELDVAPAPRADFFSSPSDPNIFDTISFRDWSFDPARTGPMSPLWDFGDGTTSTEREPTHRYTADGDYTVRLTVTTTDGRTATTTRTIAVRTHDVTITRIAVPAAVPAGHTINVKVHLRNTRLPENVRVDLTRNTPGGSTPVGSLTQPVPVLGDDETTRFVFSYTVTHDDLAAGHITFQATATIIGARDAIPTGNTRTSKTINIF